MSSTTAFSVREWSASFYCNQTSRWLYGKLVVDSNQIVFDEGNKPEPSSPSLTLIIPFGKVDTIKKMRSSVIFGSIVISLKGNQEVYWFSSFTDRNTIFLTLTHFLKFGLFEKELTQNPIKKGRTALGSDLIKVVYDSEKTLAKTSGKLYSQGEQIDNCMAIMHDIHEDVGVSENLVSGLESWFGQISATKKNNEVIAPVVIRNKDVPDIHEYEVLYYKIDDDKCPLQPMTEGIVRISHRNFVLTTSLQIVIENYEWTDISRIRAVSPWEIHLSHFCIGEPDVSYVIISAHIHKFVKKLAARLKDKFEFLESKAIGNLHIDTPRGGSISQYASMKNSTPVNYSDGGDQQQKSSSQQLISDAEVEEVSNMLTKIKSMALDINHEEIKQNEKLDVLNDSVQVAAGSIKNQTKRIKKMT